MKDLFVSPYCKIVSTFYSDATNLMVVQVLQTEEVPINQIKIELFQEQQIIEQ